MNKRNDCFNIGKIPPQDLHIERVVIASMMISENCLIEAIELLYDECFYSSANKKIFFCIKKMFERKQDVDIWTVANTLKQHEWLEEVGSEAYLSMLVEDHASSSKISTHCNILIDKAVLREAIALCSEVTTMAFDPDADSKEVLNHCDKRLTEALSPLMKKKKVVKLSDCVQPTLDGVEANKKKSGVTGVLSGLKRLDDATCGFQPSDLIIVGARPGMGKTSLALTAALNAAKLQNKNSMIFTLEMKAEQLCQRALSIESGIDLHKIRSGKIDKMDIAKLGIKAGNVYALGEHILIDDTEAISFFEIYSKVRKYHREIGIDQVFIDYLSLMSYDNKVYKSRNEGLGSITRGLKSMSKEFDFPTILLSQLSRAIEDRPIANGGRIPRLRDLRESGEIEQDADMVLFPYRHEVYDNDKKYHGLADIFIAKYRNGPVCKIPVKFINHTTEFTNLTDREEILQPELEF